MLELMVPESLDGEEMLEISVVDWGIDRITATGKMGIRSETREKKIPGFPADEENLVA